MFFLSLFLVLKYLFVFRQKKEEITEFQHTMILEKDVV